MVMTGGWFTIVISTLLMLDILSWTLIFGHMWKEPISVCLKLLGARLKWDAYCNALFIHHQSSYGSHSFEKMPHPRKSLSSDFLTPWISTSAGYIFVHSSTHMFSWLFPYLYVWCWNLSVCHGCFDPDLLLRNSKVQGVIASTSFMFWYILSCL